MGSNNFNHLLRSIQFQDSALFVTTVPFQNQVLSLWGLAYRYRQQESE